MKIEIQQTALKRFLIVIPPVMESDQTYWDSLSEKLKSVSFPDNEIYIDLKNLSELSQFLFNSLYDIAQGIGKSGASLHFTNVNELIEEQISILTTIN